MKPDTKNMTRIAVMTAVLCIAGPLTVPIGPVPVSLAPLAILLSVYILGTFGGTVSCIIYLAIGAVGIPVFSGFQGGFAKIAGPTGGYMLGYIFMALIAGWFIHKYYNVIWIQFIGMCLGMAVLYAFGTLWLSHAAGMTFKEALIAGVLPFVAFDIAKIICAIALGRAVNKRLDAGGLRE